VLLFLPALLVVTGGVMVLVLVVADAPGVVGSEPEVPLDVPQVSSR
jgi:hypothetical protein